MTKNLNSSQLKYTVYINNTESLELEKQSNINHYISVCSGLKSIYKAALDWYPGKKFKFTYVDVVPTAINFRKAFDLKCNKNSMSEILNQFEETNFIYPCTSKNKDIMNIDNIIIDEVKQLNLQHVWKTFLNEYYLAPKEYFNINIINDVDIIKKTMSKDDIIWFFFSNSFKWHQFNYSKEIFNNWKDKFKDFNITLSGVWIK